MDLNLEKEKKWTEDDVLTTHRAKTAIYTYENPLMVGAILGELSEEVKEILTEYARWGGIAFQLQDDILGLFGNPEKNRQIGRFGFVTRKKDLIDVGGVEARKWKWCWSDNESVGKEEANKDDLKKAKEAVKKKRIIGIIRYEFSRQYAKRAVDVAEKLRKHELNKKAIDYIQGIAAYMVERDV